jgi:isocitrate dehydrogenase
MEKIKMTTPIVEMDGDEMARILWAEVKSQLVEPFVDLKEEYYDLSILSRDETEDQITVDAALAAKKYGVAVKCATITANAERMKEYSLRKMYRSPNATIRSIMDGTVFRSPILVGGIDPLVKTWKKPITLARHAYGDIYRASEMYIEKPGKVELVYTAEDGTEVRQLVHEFKSSGIVSGMHNLDRSIEGFARTCMRYALSIRQNLLFSSKDTISKVYDRNFRDIFERVYQDEFFEEFMNAGIRYEYCLIDDAVSRAIKSPGGYVWATQNYDGDVMSDMLATAYGSNAMMTSVLVSPDGKYEYEAAHGTVRRHYYRYLQGEVVSTNPMALIYTWSGGLEKRGELDGNEKLHRFGQMIREAARHVIEAEGIMTGDLAKITSHPNPQVVTGHQFIAATRSELE